jgi:CSLREA domain-containing protein
VKPNQYNQLIAYFRKINFMSQSTTTKTISLSHSSSQEVNKTNLSSCLSHQLKFVSFILSVIIVLFHGTLTSHAATFTVTKTADTNDGLCDTDCSLREAVTSANDFSADDVIAFSPLFNAPQTITLDRELTVIRNGTLTISGTGASMLLISGNNTTAAFTIVDNATVNINNLEIKNAVSSSTGGAIYNAGILTVNNSKISNSGSGIYNAGRNLTINNSVLSGNAGSIYNYEGTLVITNSTFSNNIRAIYNYHGTLNLTGSIIDRNDSSGGAGLYNFNGTVNITDTIISNNSVSGSNSSGGGIFNFADGSVASVVMTISNSKITGNSASTSGGGIMNISATLTIINSTIDNNQSNQGGGIYIFSGTFNLIKSTVSNNRSAGAGGGFGNGDAISVITNSTISNNTARDGGGIYSSSANGPLTINYTTISDNRATNRGGGIARGGGEAVQINNSIIADNNVTTTIDPSPDFAGILSSQGYNLIEDTSGTTVTTRQLWSNNANRCPATDQSGD